MDQSKQEVGFIPGPEANADAACVAGATTLVPGEETYRGYRIAPALVSYMPASDWCFAHEDYDGAPDGNDSRCGYAASPEACREEIDALEGDR